MLKELLCIGMSVRVWNRDRYHRLGRRWLAWRKIMNRRADRLKYNDNNNLFFHDYLY